MATKLTTEKFIERAKQIHGCKYDYSKVKYVKSVEKVCIICPEHGEFWQTPSMHLNGQGCKKCYGNQKSDTKEFIEKAQKIHGNKYDYSKVNYVNNYTKVCIICPEHGEFWQKPNNHLHGNGCKKCSYKNAVRRQKKEKNTFIEHAIKVHGNCYDYSKSTYVNNKTKICIICHEKDKFGIEHGEFWQRPDNHLNGQQCPKCSKKISKLEKKIKNALNELHINFEQEKKFEWLNNQRLDFYLPDYNIAIECQGEQHFKPIDFAGKGIEWAKKQLENIKNRDLIKKKLCIKNGICILYYTSKKFKNLDENYITDVREIKNLLNNKKNEKIN